MNVALNYVDILHRNYVNIGIGNISSPWIKSTANI
jgi:hypothetical protein